MIAKKILRPDSKGRVCLGSLAKGVSGYKVVLNENTKEITLKPYAELALPEQWLFENKQALNQVRRGLQQSADKKTVYKGNFAKYINNDDQ
jgi:predicted transcriptional regulator YheO